MAVAAPAIEGRVEITEPNLGEKSEEPQVDAENGRTGGGKDTAHGKQRAVAAQNNDQFRLVERHIAAIDGFGGSGVLACLAIQQGLVAALAQPGDQLRQNPG